MLDIRRSTKQYEDWLRKQLKGDVVRGDLARKHAKMREGPFAFLRATYWRWAETVLATCPDLAKAPRVLAVGDMHLENFGTWRDADGRLVWGVNDFDEAAEMPYAVDLVRLATSALLAPTRRGITHAGTCSALLDGYLRGLQAPAPVVLDRDYRWLRKLVVIPERERKSFWKKIEAAKLEAAPARYRKALAAGMPQTGLAFRTARRTAGAGSLGRPRWIGIADWRGAPVVREAKALLPSSWQRAHGGSAKIRCGGIAGGAHRAIDPWLAVRDNIVVRRLSPNNRKIEAVDEAFATLSAEMIGAMGQDLASVHLGIANRAKVIARDLARREQGWLAASSERMAEATRRDFKAYGGTL